MMNFETPGSTEITYNDEKYEIEYIYYSINPDDLEIHEIYNASGKKVDDKIFEEIERHCQNHVLGQIREEMIRQNENFKRRI